MQNVLEVNVLLAPPELSLLWSSLTVTAAQEPLQKLIPVLCLCFLKETNPGISADKFLSEQAQCALARAHWQSVAVLFNKKIQKILIQLEGKAFCDLSGF